jgi:hypothetical protein
VAQISLIMEGDGCWPELSNPSKILNLMGEGAPPIKIALLAGGMESGRPSVTFRIDLPDGRSLLTETSARLFCATARTIMAKFPDLFAGD